MLRDQLVCGPDQDIGGPDVVHTGFAAVVARAEHVQADARDHGREPPAEVLHVAGVGALQPQPRLLDRVVGLVEGPEHPVGHAAEVRAVVLEARGQLELLVHRSHPPVASVPLVDPRETAGVTDARRSRSRAPRCQWK
jgi:hypothetical protein